MTEDQALDQMKLILNKKNLSGDDIDKFIELEEFVPEFIFGDLFEALYAVCPQSLIWKLSGDQP